MIFPYVLILLYIDHFLYRLYSVSIELCLEWYMNAILTEPYSLAQLLCCILIVPHIMRLHVALVAMHT